VLASDSPCCSQAWSLTDAEMSSGMATAKASTVRKGRGRLEAATIMWIVRIPHESDRKPAKSGQVSHCAPNACEGDTPLPRRLPHPQSLIRPHHPWLGNSRIEVLSDPPGFGNSKRVSTFSLETVRTPEGFS